jgi:hypothetical protein
MRTSEILLQLPDAAAAGDGAAAHRDARRAVLLRPHPLAQPRHPRRRAGAGAHGLHRARQREHHLRQVHVRVGQAGRPVPARKAEGARRQRPRRARPRRAHRGQPRPGLPARDARERRGALLLHLRYREREAAEPRGRGRGVGGVQAAAPFAAGHVAARLGRPAHVRHPAPDERRGLVYVVIVLGTSPMGDNSFYETVRPLAPTLAIMLVSTLGAACSSGASRAR